MINSINTRHRQIRESNSPYEDFQPSAIPLSVSAVAVGAFVAAGGNRTHDTEILSLLFYLLNYLPHITRRISPSHGEISGYTSRSSLRNRLLYAPFFASRRGWHTSEYDLCHSIGILAWCCCARLSLPSLWDVQDVGLRRKGQNLPDKEFLKKLQFTSFYLSREPWKIHR